MPELRVEISKDIAAVLDGYCSATGQCRTQLIVGILGDWTEQKLHESTIVCRVAGVNPMASDKKI